MHIEWLMANGDVGELTSSVMPSSPPPGGVAYVLEYLHVADAATEGVTVRKRTVAYDERRPRPLVASPDEEPCVVVPAGDVPRLLRLDANGVTRLARLAVDEDGSASMDPEGELVAVQLPAHNVIAAAGTPRHDGDDDDGLSLADLVTLIDG